jgi:hypothetical protein
MTPRFKGKPNFDFSLPCPLCGYKIQPNELMRVADTVCHWVVCHWVVRLSLGCRRHWVVDGCYYYLSVAGAINCCMRL